jgi:hypothetical protein
MAFGLFVTLPSADASDKGMETSEESFPANDLPAWAGNR